MTMRPKKTLIVAAVLTVAAFVRPATAQQSDVDLTSRDAVTRISTSAVYQEYEADSLSVSELSFPVSVSVPLGQDLSLGVNASFARVTGDGLEDLSGITDTRVSLNWVRRLGEASVVATLGASLPTGKEDLTFREFGTLMLLSQNAFDFTVPGFGQGFGVFPALAVAFPANDDVVIGVGASYQHRGAYRPVDILNDDYTPGNEILLTGGADYRVNPSTSVSLDLTATMYAADRLGSVDVYQAGRKITITSMVRHIRGFNELRGLVVYRSRAKSDELAGVELVTQEERTLPNQFTIQGSYLVRLTAALRATLLAEARIFEETAIYPSRSIIDVGVLPRIRLTDTTFLTTRFIYSAGDITGFEAGAGLSIAL